MTSPELSRSDAPVRASIWNNERVRGVLAQLTIVAALLLLVGVVARNTFINLTKMNQDLGFGFLAKPAGFDVVQSLVPYSSTSSYGQALLVGFLNTAIVSILAIVAATILGFILGVMRLSRNRLASQVAGGYIEFFRNIPVLLQIFVWYSLVVLQVLPMPRAALNVFGMAFLSNRGLVLPRPIFGADAELGVIALVLAVVCAIAISIWARRRRDATGRSFPTKRIYLALLILLPLAGFAIAGFPVTFDFPVKTTFNFSGGMFVLPEMVALFMALSTYFATYIAEAVRAGIQAVGHGQTEAAHALGLDRGQTLWRILVPQAVRMIVPPLISIYLGITKTSSLGVAIGYPDLVAIGGTVLNQTGRAIEVVTIWMLVYLSLSLSTSLFMNWFSARFAIRER